MGEGKKQRMQEEKQEEYEDNKEYEIIIAEKPNAAMRIAYALADIAPVKRNFKGVPYWEVNHKGRKIIVLAALGHLFELQEKNPTKEWPIFEVEWKLKKSIARRYASVIAFFAKKASEFIVGCDYDVEGELIGFNVLRFICQRENAKRMKFSTLTKHELLDSYENAMSQIDFGQAYAGETRHYLDYYYGINLSRALMEAIKKAGLYHILSIGRVQGPALALVVAKEKEIQNFKPKPYWKVFIKVKGIKLEYGKEIFNEEEALGFKELEGKNCELFTEKEEKKVFPFPPFDLTSLQLESYRLFGLTPAQTLSIAQRLYLQGLISYPRTSSQKLPPSIGYTRILAKLNKLYFNLTKHITRKKPIEGKKTDPAHPCIFPTGETAKLSSTEKQIYELIVKRFISCFCLEALVEKKKVRAKVGKYEFSSEGKKVLEKGWLEVYPAKIEEKKLPDIEGKFKIEEVILEKKETKPPRRYTAASLVAELEKRTLGTKATRAMIVDTLYKRGYIKERTIVATNLGIKVVETLEKNCPLILDEALTRSFEQKMNSIQQERDLKNMQKKQKEILEEARKILEKIAKEFKTKEEDIGKELLEAYSTIKKEREKANTLCECPICGEGSLIVYRSRKNKRFLACNKCKKSFALPQYGLIKLAEKKCECGFPLLLLIKKRRPPWQFCFNPECKTRKVKGKVVGKTKKRKKRKK